MPRLHPAYTPAEDAWLRANYATTTIAAAEAALPARSWKSLQCRSYLLGLGGQRPGGGIERLAWPPEALEALDRLYPTGVAAAVAAVTGHTLHGIRMEAQRRGVRYVRGSKPRKPRNPRKRKPANPILKMKATPTPALALQMPRKAAATTAPKRSAATPRLNAQKAKVERSADAKKFAVVYTASEIRAMPYSSAIRQIYTRGGDPAVRAYLAARP